jgi:hypothetical protein
MNYFTDVFIFLYKQWTDLILLFHFLVWSFPYLDLGNDEVYNLKAFCKFHIFLLRCTAEEGRLWKYENSLKMCMQNTMRKFIIQLKWLVKTASFLIVT